MNSSNGMVGLGVRSTVQRSARKFFFWISLVPVTLALLSLGAAARYQNSIGWVLHTKDVIVSIQDLRAAVNSAASMHALASLTGRASERKDYIAAWQKVEEQIPALQQLTADNPTQRANVDHLIRAAEKLRTKLDSLLQQRLELHLNGEQPSIAAFTADVQLITAFRKVCSDMIAEENGLMGQRLASQRRVGTYLGVCFFLGIASFVALLVRAYKLIGRYELQRNTAEGEIRALNAELELRVEERTVELQHANDDLVRSNTDLTQFAYVASHDLQEPLRTVASYASLLSRRYQGKLDAQADQYIRFVVEGASRMQTLVRDLLAYSRVGTEALKLASVDVGQLVTTVSDSLRVLIAERNAQITFDNLPTLNGDAGRLGQVFQNLLGNALKFSKPDEQPKIHINAQHREADWLFSVQDNGIGFESAYAEKIFVIFQRLHRIGAYPGTGIGLAVCKRIVEAHGGRIWAASELGIGSTFFFTIAPKLGKNEAGRNGADRHKYASAKAAPSQTPEAIKKGMNR